MIKPLSLPTSNVTPLFKPFSSPSTNSKTPLSPSITSTGVSASIGTFALTPQKMKALTGLIIAVSELIGELRGIINDFRKPTSGAGAESPVPTQPPTATPSETPNTMMENNVTSPPSPSTNLSPSATIPSVGAIAPTQQGPMELLIESLVGKLTHLEQVIASLLGATTDTRTTVPPPSVTPLETSSPSKPEKSFWGNLLKKGSELVMEYLPKKDVLSTVGSFFSSGGNYLKNLFSSFF